MYYQKRYLQFNDLVFDGYDMISDYDEPIQYKGSSTAYTNGHGSYMPFKNTYLYVSERQVNMTLTLKLKKVPCEYRLDYVKFAEQELGRPGRLWAIKNNEIIWAFARVNNMRPVSNSRQDEVEWDIEFLVPGGVWNKADKQRTFLLPYNICALMDCKKFEEYNPCEQEIDCKDCCNDCIEKKAIKQLKEDCSCCCEDAITKDMALCYHLENLQKFYSCDTPYQLAYSCEKASEFSQHKFLGKKLCTDDACGNIIAGRFYSETDIPTKDVSIIIDGNMKNPAITINGNTNIIKGEYETLRIESSGDVYALTECCETLLDPSLWQVPRGQDYGWTVNPKLNSIIVNLNMCCGRSCVYVQDQPITT